jgi:hypothetical protein
MMRRTIIAAALALGLVAPVASAQAAAVTLKPGQDRMLGKRVTLMSMRVVGGERLKHIGATSTGEGCWSSPRTFYESCTVLTDCRVQGCWVGNESRVRVRVRFRRSID